MATQIFIPNFMASRSVKQTLSQFLLGRGLTVIDKRANDFDLVITVEETLNNGQRTALINALENLIVPTIRAEAI